MPRMVSAPHGLVQVITEGEFKALKESFKKREYKVSADLEPACLKCGCDISIILVSHVVLIEEMYTEIPTWETAYDSNEIWTYYRSYCPYCEGQPNPIGPPVVFEGSFYDVH